MTSPIGGRMIVGLDIGTSKVVAIVAEIGIQRRAKKKQPGWYLGWHWSSPVGRSAWAENTWASGSTAGVARNYLNLVNTGLDVRLVLPE